MESFVLLTKDVFATRYLPTYGDNFWKTPNIDALAEKGTVFYRHYTAAPSTAMSFTSMFTTKYPYQLDRRTYVHVDDMKDTVTFFNKLEKQGFSNHIIWSKNYLKAALPFSNCFGSAKTVFHNLDINRSVGPHVGGKKISIVRDDEVARNSMNSIYTEIDSALNTDKPVFLWIHLPHVILGRTGYGDDIDLVDELVGYLREKFGDNNIFISADHGNMDGKKNKCVYGFDVYEPAVRIPLITPRLENTARVDRPTSNKDIETVLLERRIPSCDFVCSDTAYFAQPHRKFAVIGERYKYIYNKKTKTEELYDIIYDPNEEVNLAVTKLYDVDRKVTYEKAEVYFYPYWDEAAAKLNEYREFKNSIWRTGTFYEEKLSGIIKTITKPRYFIKAIIKNKKNKL